MKACVQWNPNLGWKNSLPQAGLKPGTARSAAASFEGEEINY